MKNAAFVILTTALLSCSDNASNDDSLIDVQGCVTLPAGVEAVEVVNAASSARVRKGCYTIQVLAPGEQLTVAVSADGDPLVMGWISPEKPDLSPATTSTVLSYLALGGPAVGPDASTVLIDLLAEDETVQDIATLIESELAASSRAFSNDNDAVRTALAAFAQSVAGAEDGGSDSEPPPPAVLINPGDEQSGVRVNASGAGEEITLVNTLRRGAYAWVHRISTFDEDGNETESPAKIAEFKVDSVQALQGWVDGINQIVTNKYSGGESEDVAYVPRSSAPVRVENIENAAKTRYEVTVVGPGPRAGRLADLTSDQRLMQQYTSVEFIAKDFVLPLTLTFVIPKLGINEFYGSEFLEDIVKDVANLIFQQIPNAATKIAEGDVKGGLKEIWDAIWSSGALQNALFEIIRDRFYDFRTAEGVAAFDRATAVAKGFANVTGAVDAFFTGTDGAFLFASVLQSRRAEIWTVDVTDTKVNMLPAQKVLFPKDKQRFQVYVPGVDDDATLEYRFSSTGTAGFLSNDWHQGDEITSSQNWIDYTATEDEGTDTITVEVYEVRLSDRIYLGKTESTVEIADDCDKIPFEESSPIFFSYTAGHGDNPHHMGKWYVIYVFEKDPESWSYLANIEPKSSETYHYYPSGVYTVTKYQFAGTPTRSYHDDHTLRNLYNARVADAVNLSDNELAYIPHTLTHLSIHTESGLADYEANKAMYEAQALDTFVGFKPYCD